MVIASYEQYMLALQEERRKIEVFQRELPLCLDLVDQAIENCKRQVCYTGDGERSECEEEDEQTSSEGPVLEQFIPIKRSSSSDDLEQEQEQERSNSECNEKSGNKVDWLRSVQLWNQSPEQPPSQQQDNNHTPNPLIKENGGAFLPFQKIKAIKTATTPAAAAININEGTTTVPSPVPTASTSSTADNSHKRKEEREGQLNRKSRRCWSPELHRRFLQALQQLGGSHAATPKQIRELMKVDGLTNDEVKSHLQKYRLHTRRPGPSAHNNGNTQPTQFVVVGGIWVPPQNYATSAAATKGDATSAVNERIYVPVAAPPQLTQPQQQRKLLQLSTGSSHSEQKSSRAEHSIGDVNTHSGSPSTSSSTETTTASPSF